jgi:hypothetical protein
MKKNPAATAKVARSSKVVRLNDEDAVSVTPEHSIGKELLLVHFMGLHFFPL